MIEKIKNLLAGIKPPWKYLGWGLIMFFVSFLYWFVYGIFYGVKKIISLFKKKTDTPIPTAVTPIPTAVDLTPKSTTIKKVTVKKVGRKVKK